MEIDEKFYRWVEFTLRQEFNRLWDSNSLPFASDQKPYINKDEYYEKWKNEAI